MKKILLLIIIVLTIFTACEEVLDKEDFSGLSDANVWDDEILANLYLNRVYRYVLPGFAGSSNVNLSDESTGGGTGNMMYGELSKDANYGNFIVTTYRNIRYLNILLEEIDKGSLEPAEKNPIKGQALFLRAWIYWELVKLYGGVPMIMTPQDPFKREQLYIPRSPASVCMNIIVNDLNEAIYFLELDGEPNGEDKWPEEEWGRVTMGAAAALKGRVLLFYASPQFNPDDLPERWEAAYQANVEAKEICSDAYELHSDFKRIFLDEASSTEAIFVTIYDGVEISHGYENAVRPSSEASSGSSSNCPTWELVCAFPMIDGRPIDNHPLYDSIYYWQNRDPRFYATIAYNGCEWGLSGQSNRRQWDYVGNGIEPANPEAGASNTGFYCRKNVDESLTQGQTGMGQIDWIEIRYTEVLLNLAECANEYDQLSEAYDELIAIRARACIEAGGDGLYGLKANMTKDEMREAIMLERQIEMSYENKRHWDLRRRNMFINDLGDNTKKLNGTRRHGVQILLDTLYLMSLDTNIKTSTQAINYFNANIRDTFDVENNYHTYFITDFNWERDEKDIDFLQPKYNFYFMPQSELDENPRLQQTIYWGEGNTFDPLED